MGLLGFGFGATDGVQAVGSDPVRLVRPAILNRRSPVVPAGRLAASLIGSLAVVVGLGACGSSAGSSEAVISGKIAATTSQELEAELKMVTDIPSFTKGWKDATQKDANVGKKYSPELVAYVLQNRYFNSLIQQEAKARKLEPAEMTATFTQNLAGATPGGEETLNAYPAKYRDDMLLTQRYIEALLLAAGGDPKEYFDKNPDKFTTACVQHILVASEVEAIAAQQRISGGETFDKVAADVSTDPGSKDNGGDLGCQPLSTYVPEFSSAAAVAELNKVTEPVKSDFGYHLILVTKRDVGKWDDTTQEQAKQAVQQAGVEEIRTALTKRATDAGTVVNPKFAVLNTSGGIPQIDVRPTPGATTTVVGELPQG
jgi:parvulin-like peptidyl-prolyl isomerase